MNSDSNFITTISLNNQHAMTRLVLIDPNPHQCSQEMHYYPFRVQWKIYIDAMEVVILLMIYVVKLVSQTKWKMQV